MQHKLLLEPVFVGRERELEELNTYLNLAVAGKGTTVFVSGEAGSGKTRLTSEFLRTARENNIIVLTGWCLSNTAVPYFPFTEAFESFLAENEEDKIINSQRMGLKTWLMTSNKTSQEEMSPQTWKDQKFAAITKELLFLSTDKPLILFIDDLHWADSASLSLLHYVARAIKSERILVLATFRSEESGLNFEGFTHPLLDTLRLMGREDLFTEIKLLSLSTFGVSHIAESMLNGKVNQELVSKLTEESRGNPLFIIESLRMMFESGSLGQKDGKWQLFTEKMVVPLKVKDIILRRLSALKPNQRRTLDVASVIGDKFNPQLLGQVLNQDSLEVLETLNSVALSRSLVTVEGDYYRFDHAISREVLYEEIFLPLKKGYHQRIAEKIECLSQDSKDIPFNDLAYHYTQAGNNQKSIEYNLAAGIDALARFSNAEAIRDFTHVIEMIDDESKDSERKVAAMEGLGDAFFASGKFEQAIQTFEKISTKFGSETVKLRALRKAVVACYWRGDSRHALDLAYKAKDYSEVDQLEYARVRLYKGFVSGRSHGQFNQAIEDMKASLRVFEEMCSLPDVARALAEISFAYPWVGVFEESLSAAILSVALYEELADSRQYAFALGRLGTALVSCAFIKEALEVYAKANIIDEKIGDYNTLAFHHMMSAICLETMGNKAAAINESLRGLEAAEKTDAAYAKSLCLANLVREYSLLEDVDRADEYQKTLDKLFAGDLVLKNNINAVTQTQLSKAILLGHKGRYKEALELFEKDLQSDQFSWKSAYAWLLEKRGRSEEARMVRVRLKVNIENLRKKFEHANVKAHLLVLREANINEEIKIRLDILNIGKAPAELESIEKLIPLDFKASLLSTNGKLEYGSLRISEKKLEALGIFKVKINLIAFQPGIYNLQPHVNYTDDMGKAKILVMDPITITVKPKTGLIQNRTSVDSETVQIQLKSIAAQKVLDSLVKAFREDSLLKFSQERCGWRTYMDLVKQCKVSKHSVYGSKGSQGHAITELERNGLVQTRIFTGERGRGGSVTKIRINQEKEFIKIMLEQK